MSPENSVDISELWPLNGPQLTARTSHGSGRFSDGRSFGSQTRFPRDGENCRSISVVRRMQSSRFCAVPVFDEVASTERNLGSGTNSRETDCVSVGHRLLSGSGKNSFKKSIFTSVLVAVALRIEWF